VVSGYYTVRCINIMKQLGLFDDQIAFDRLDKCLDPLLRLNEAVE
jgi:hypothetical protein